MTNMMWFVVSPFFVLVFFSGEFLNIIFSWLNIVIQKTLIIWIMVSNGEKKNMKNILQTTLWFLMRSHKPLCSTFFKAGAMHE